MNRSNSDTLFREAVLRTPGGVHSPVRAFQAVGGTPVFFAGADGATLTDADGNRYVDLVNSWGANILGHAHPAIVRAIREQASRGTSFGAPHEGEIRLAKLVTERVPGLESVRFVNSGTEATLSAIRLARAFTGKRGIVKFAGNYHGAVDALLVEAGSGVATLAMPDSAGVVDSQIADTHSIPYNDLAAVEHVLSRHSVAAVLVEPVAGNMGCVPPDPGYLAGLRSLCDAYDALLVFDEVMTGFRVARGGASERYSVVPDLYTLGKVIGGGLPVGAYGGRKEIMDQVAPLGPVYQAGTLSGNPLAMAAGAAALENLTPDLYDRLESLGARLEQGLQDALPGARVQRVGSMISVFFAGSPVREFADARRSDRARYAAYFHRMLDQGIYLPPSPLESWFLSAALTEADVDAVVAASR
jgi:glutamate-1-semialdehyde 2,1-aminomutase